MKQTKKINGNTSEITANIRTSNFQGKVDKNKEDSPDEKKVQMSDYNSHSYIMQDKMDNQGNNSFN
jgi:hypothetical protein